VAVDGVILEDVRYSYLKGKREAAKVRCRYVGYAYSRPAKGPCWVEVLLPSAAPHLSVHPGRDA